MNIRKKTYELDLVEVLIDPFQVTNSRTSKEESRLEKALKESLVDVEVTNLEFYHMIVQLEKIEESFICAGCAVALSDLAGDVVRVIKSKKIGIPGSISNLQIITDRPLILNLKTFVNELLRHHTNGDIVQINERIARTSIELVRILDELSTECDTDKLQSTIKKAEVYINNLLSSKIICSRIASILMSDFNCIKHDSIKELTCQ